MKQRYLVDILIPYAKRGGPENIINLLAEFSSRTPIRFRVIQYVYDGVKWTDPRLEFHSIYPEGMNQNTDTFINGYAGFLSNHPHPDLILATAWPFMSYVAKLVKQMLSLSCPVVSWMHANLLTNARNGFGDIKAIAYADAHLAINHQIEAELQVGLPGAKILHVLNPIDDRKIINTIPHPVDGKAVFIGRLEKIKGADLAIAAIASVTAPWTLDIYGSGEQEEMLRQLVRELDLDDRIRFMGWCENPWITASDAQYLIAPSRYECMPLTGLEALSNGVPVIATDCDGFREFIRPGANGYIVPQEDFGKIADLLDATYLHLLKRPGSKDCHDSITPYYMKNALGDFCDKLLSLIAER